MCLNCIAVALIRYYQTLKWKVMSTVWAKSNTSAAEGCKAASLNNPSIYLKWIKKNCQRKFSYYSAWNFFFPSMQCCWNSSYFNKIYELSFRNISTVFFNMLKILKNITAQCPVKSRNSQELSPTGTPTQSGNRRRRLKESRRRGWGDLWWGRESKNVLLISKYVIYLDSGP